MENSKGTEQVIDILKSDIDNIKNVRNKLEQRKTRDPPIPPTPTTPSSLLTQESITTICSKINTMLRNCFIKEINLIAYPDNCYMLNINEIANTIEDILALEEENRNLMHKMNIKKEKERQSDSKLNRSTMLSERRMTELEGAVTTLKSKLTLKEREVGELRDKYDYKNAIDLPTKSIGFAEIKKLELELERVHRKNRELEKTIEGYKSMSMIDDKYREALIDIDALKNECSALKDNNNSNIMEIENLYKQNTELTQQISLLEAENASLKQNKYAIEENNSILAECDHLRELNTELQDQIKLLESELSKLKSDGNATSDLRLLKSNSVANKYPKDAIYYKQLVEECCEVLKLESPMSLISSIRKVQKLLNTCANMEAFIKQIQLLMDDEKCSTKDMIANIKIFKQQARTGAKVIEVLTKIKELMYSSTEKKDIEQIYNECSIRLDQYSILCEYVKSIEHIFEGELNEKLIKDMEDCQTFRKEVGPYISSYMDAFQETQVTRCLDIISDMLKQRSVLESIKIQKINIKRAYKS